MKCRAKTIQRAETHSEQINKKKKRRKKNPIKQNQKKEQKIKQNKDRNKVQYLKERATIEKWSCL